MIRLNYILIMGLVILCMLGTSVFEYFFVKDVSEAVGWLVFAGFTTVLVLIVEGYKWITSLMHK